MLLTGAVQSVQACTGVRVIAEDGIVVRGRTLEFAIDIHSDVIMIPRGYARVGTTPDGKEGLKMEGEVRQRGGKWRGAALPV